MTIKEDVVYCNLWPHIDEDDNKNLFRTLSTGKYRKVFINAAQEVRIVDWLDIFGGTKVQFERCFEKHNIELMILYGGYTNSPSITYDPTVNTSIVNYPLYFAYDILTKEPLDYTLDEEVPDQHIQYLLSMLNNRKRINRKVAIDRLASKDLLKHSVYSWQSLSDQDRSFRFKYFDGKPNRIDSKFDNVGYGNQVPFSIYESAFQIIGESFDYEFDNLFLTEKTFLGILRHRPFVLIGKPGLNDSIETFGFRNYINDIPLLRQYENDWKMYSFSREWEKWHKEHIKYISGFTDIVADYLKQFKDKPDALYVKHKDKATFNRERYKEIIQNNLFSIPLPVIRFLEDTPFEASNKLIGHYTNFK